MIYVSSSCVKHKKIKDSIQELVDNGFRNIELSGGTEYYDGFENDLIELKEKYSLNYVCHNYFPPPKEHFVLNLASSNNEIYEKSFLHLQRAIELSKSLGAKNFAFHAGFFIDIKVAEIGKKISKSNLFDKEESIARFCKGYKELQKESGELKLYIENNVFSSTNHKTYNGENLFMLTNFQEFKKLREEIDFELLLDVAHLKVSSNSLELNFEEELTKLMTHTNYVHISDNDALDDLNHRLQRDSLLIEKLKKQKLKEKNFTLEIYADIDSIKESYEIMQEIIG